MSQENVEAVRLSIEAYRRGDWLAATAYLAPDVIWEVGQELPAQGPAAIRDMWQRWTSDWQELEMVGEELMDAGDKVVVPAGAKAVVMYRTGQMQTASGALTIAEPEKKAEGSLYSRTLNTISQVASTDAAKQPNRQGMIRPVEGAPAPISPRNAISIMDVRPQLMWFKRVRANLNPDPSGGKWTAPPRTCGSPSTPRTRS